MEKTTTPWPGGRGVARAPSSEGASLLAKAVAFHRAGDLDEAERCYKRVLRLDPRHFDALHLLGVVEAARAHYDKARRLVGQALKVNPRSAEAQSTLGRIFYEMKRLDEALGCYERALAIAPEDAQALCNRGTILEELGRPDEALVSYDAALALKPDYLLVLYNRGNVLHDLRRIVEAIASYDAALALKPDHAAALYNRGNALHEAGRIDEALASYGKALTVKPDYADALNNAGNALFDLKRPEESAQTFRHLLDLAPDYEFARGNMLRAQMHACDWSEFAAIAQRVIADVVAGRRGDLPFSFLTVSDSPAAQLQCARTYVRYKDWPSKPALWRGERYEHAKIRIAYLSADFDDHAMPYLMAQLFEIHDRARFEVFAISFGSVTTGPMRERLQRAFDRFIDVRLLSDRAIAALVREQEIDIAIDLKGYTQESRPGILALRPAPVQVNYMGYPGTMAAPEIDYIIADGCVIPDEDRVHYREKIAYLPDTYYVTDTTHRLAEEVPSRAELGLPPGFVFGCFNNNYKITPAIFDVWMRLLRQVEGSALWLLEDNPTAVRNLRAEAQKRGVAPMRLVFAPRVKLDHHLARHRRADLFLDTLPYNAHTTATDALWAGLPVLTCRGTSFVGRVAASVLGAVGLPELITHSLEDYESLALRLATEPAALAAISARLQANRETLPLFQTDRFRRHIEAAYIAMHERSQRGAAPATFVVEPVTPA
jgi:predicted O-linked N-acetylglucosamine transferase (SPINDLY family)